MEKKKELNGTNTKYEATGVYVPENRYLHIISLFLFY
jgi:hypothetical protein